MKIKYTAKIRRGLLLMGWVCAEVADDEASAQATMRKWTARQHAEFQAACRWVGQEADRTPAGMGALSGENTETAAFAGMEQGK